MRVLFLNYTFPGPFQHWAAFFGRRADTTTLFAAEYGRRDFSLPGVQRVVLPRPRERNQKNKALLSEQERLEWDMAMSFQRGRMTASSFLKLRQKGFVPDIIISSATMGNSFFLRTVFPEAFWVAYGDWYFAQGKPGKAFPVRNLSMWWRNNLQISTLCESNWMVTSTEWQKRQYPPTIGKNIHVLPMCVDTEFFSPLAHAGPSFSTGDFAQAQELVTLVGNGVEPAALLRSLRSLPFVLERRKTCHAVVLTGTDASTTGLFLKKGAVSDDIAQRIHPLTFLPDEAYRSLLQSTSLYVYPAGSAMLSSGLLEAMSCGCRVLGGDCEAVREIIQDGRNGFLCTWKEPSVLAKNMVDLLEEAPFKADTGKAARESIQNNYSVERTLKENMKRLAGEYSRWKEHFSGREDARGSI